MNIEKKESWDFVFIAFYLLLISLLYLLKLSLFYFVIIFN